MPRVRIVVEFNVEKGLSYFKARHILSEGLQQSPEMRWRKPKLLNVGYIVGAAITAERARVRRETMVPFGGTISQRQANEAVAAYRKAHPDAVQAAEIVAFFEMKNPDGTKDDSLRRAMTETPKFGATLEFEPGEVPPFLRPGYVPEPRKPSWWARLLARLSFGRGGVSGTFTGPAPLDGGEPMKISFTNLERYRK